MKRVLPFVIVATMLVACNTTPPLVVNPVETVTVKEAVAQKCIDRLPPVPALPPVPETGIDAQTIARIKREQALKQYVYELRILAQPCIEEAK